MKVVVRLAVLVAALLLVSNVAFANGCNQEFCYNVTVTPEPPGSPVNTIVYVCLQNDGIGEICSGIGGCGNLYEFGGGPGFFNFSGNPAFGGNPLWNAWIGVNGSGVALLHTMGSGRDILTGIGEDGVMRYLINGTKIPISICTTT